MKYFYPGILILLFSFPRLGFAQISEAYDDFEGNSNIPSWVGDNCNIDTNFNNIFPEENNLSATVLRYEDTGGQYANVRFQMNDNFDLSTNQTFSLQIYVPSSGITGNQNNQVSLKLQDGSLSEPWTTQSEVIMPILLDEWQTITFNFEEDNFINLDPNSIAPTQRTDFNRVVIQVNGENNSDHVLAFIDDILLFETPNNEPVFDRLVWSDEFDVDGPIDPQKWFHQTQFPQGNSWYNGEIQHYTDRQSNSFIQNGILNIVAKKESYTDQNTTKEYTSARLNSKFAFTYGRVEIRAKLPTGVGTWPALWMLGKNITENGAYWQTQGYGTTGWPFCGEIDIIEHWGNNQDYVSSAIHTPSSHGATVNQAGRILPNASTAFHDYTLVWTEEKMTFSVDGITHYVYDPEVKNSNTWPFDLDQYILFNVAILPNIEPGFVESPLEIDYIRIYQESDIGLPIHLLSFNGAQEENHVILNWSTAREINNDYFSIEKLLANDDWEEIGQIKGAGNSYGKNDYQFIDHRPHNGWNYYRLKQIDYDGKTTFSTIESVAYKIKDATGIEIYPNPALNQITIKGGADLYKIEIINSVGQKNLDINSNETIKTVDISALTKGLYFVNVKNLNGDLLEVKKIIKR